MHIEEFSISNMNNKKNKGFLIKNVCIKWYFSSDSFSKCMFVNYINSKK